MSVELAVVVNPVKVSDPDELRRQIAERSSAETGWWQTTEQDPGAGQAAEAVAAGAKLVLVCGGDGTVAACAGALAGTGVAMAVLPDGTGNLLARNLGIPLDPSEALDLAFGQHQRQLDVLDAGDRRFLVMAGLGFDAALIDETDEDFKAKVGWLAYLGGLARAIRGHRRSSYLIELDGQPPVQHRAIGVLVGNVGDLQGGITLLPDAQPDDGLLDVITLAPHKLLDWPVLIGRILRQRPDAGEQANVMRAQRVRITVGRPVPAEFDGDFAGERTELAVEVLAGALILKCAAR